VKTPTERALLEVADRDQQMPKNYYLPIQQLWRCELNSCRNKDLTCFVDNRQHFKIDVNDLKAWSDAIIVGRATVNNPPRTLRLRPAMEPKRHRRGKPGGYSSDPEDSHRHRQYQPPNINVHVHGSTVSGSKTSTVVKGSSPDSPDSPDNVAMRSSPPIAISSDDDLHMLHTSSILAQYIDWHVAKSPGDVKVLGEAFRKLNKESIKFEHLASLDSGFWRLMKIPIGIGLTLSNETNDFIKNYNIGGTY